MDNDLLHPAKYKANLRGIQAQVCRESAAAQEILETRTSDAETNITPDSRFQECQKIFECIQQNIAVLQNAGFCISAATFLQIGSNRTRVTFLRSFDLDKVAHLGRCIDKTKTSLENLGVLDSGCEDLLHGCLAASTPPVNGDCAIIFLQVLDLVLVSHVYSHMEDFDHLSKYTSTTKKFQISSQGSGIIYDSVLSEKGTMNFFRRTFKCLDGFLCSQQVQVLHGPDIDPKDLTELFLSTTLDAFADVWGPMWKITNAGRPMEILWYDLEHGSVVPTSLLSGKFGYAMAAELDEELCHWIPNNRLKQFERTLASTSPQITHLRLIIGACVRSIT